MVFDEASNSIWVAGERMAPSDNVTGNSYGILVHLSALDGTMLLYQLFGNETTDASFTSIVMKDSFLYLVGSFNTEEYLSGDYFWLVQCDSSGNETNSLIIPADGGGIDIALSDNNLIVLGNSFEDWDLDGIHFTSMAVWVGAFDANLSLQWMTEFQQLEDAVALAVSNGTVFLCGTDVQSDNDNLYDIYLAMVDAATGQHLDLKYCGTSKSYEAPTALFALGDLVWIAGQTDGTYGAEFAGALDIVVQPAHLGPALQKQFLISVIIGTAVGGAALLLILVGLVVFIVKKKNKKQPVELPQAEDSAPREAHKYSTRYETLGLRGSPSPDSPPVSPETTSQELLPVTNRPASALTNDWLIDYTEIRLDKKIGQGAFGEVFKAKYRGSSVAVKQMVVTVEDDVKIQDFFAEAELMKGLRPHPNITQLLGVCTHPLCIVTEFVANGSLYSWLKSDKPLDDTSKFEIIKGTAAGMKILNSVHDTGMLHLHRQGVIHRDLAARNILLDKSMHPKVADFGLSRVTLDNVTNKTEASVGPVKWMAPEALLERVYNQKTDVWSFGVVIYEVLTREMPYKNYNLMQIGAAVGVGKLSLVPEIENRQQDYPPLLVEVLKQCLQFEAKSRPDFQQIVDQLDQHAPLGQSTHIQQ